MDFADDALSVCVRLMDDTFIGTAGINITTNLRAVVPWYDGAGGGEGNRDAPRGVVPIFQTARASVGRGRGSSVAIRQPPPHGLRSTTIRLGGRYVRRYCRQRHQALRS